MQFNGMRGAWQRTKARLHGAVLQDCPPELAACEVCNRPHCSNDAWLRCERRLAAQRYLEAGDQAALQHLREEHAAAASACAKPRPESPAS